MKPANYAPVYCALYPDFAEIARKHGYAMAIHGSLAKDLDLICIPWVDTPSEPQAVVAEITGTFAVQQIGEPETRFGRLIYTVSIGHGHCALDLSFMALVSPPPASEPETVIRLHAPAAETVQKLQDMLAANTRCLSGLPAEPSCSSCGDLGEIDVQCPDCGKLVASSAPVVDKEPVAWQWRYRGIGKEIGEWTGWCDGRAPAMRGSSYETEERPLFTAPPSDELVRALEEARTDIVMAIAFLGRDAESDRLPTTATQLVEILAKRERIIAALASSPSGRTEG